MSCPKCGYKQVCPCNHCTKVRKEDNVDIEIKPWIFKDNGNIECANCGFEGSFLFWNENEKKEANKK